MEILALHKNDVHLAEGYVSLPGTKNVRAKRDVPLTDERKEVLKGVWRNAQWLHLPRPQSQDEEHGSGAHYELSRRRTSESSKKPFRKGPVHDIYFQAYLRYKALPGGDRIAGAGGTDGTREHPDDNDLRPCRTEAED